MGDIQFAENCRNWASIEPIFKVHLALNAELHAFTFSAKLHFPLLGELNFGELEW